MKMCIIIIPDHNYVQFSQGSINNTRQELLSIVRKNTNKTNKLHELTTRSRQLEQGLNIRQRSTVSNNSSNDLRIKP